MTDAADQFDHVEDRQNGGLTARVVAIATKHGNYGRGWVSHHREGLRPFLMMAAIALFCTGLFISLRAYPAILQQLQFGPLAVLLVAVLPLGLVINAIDFQILARLSDVKVSIWQSLVTIIYTRAANMLPIPGSIFVRMAVLKSSGAKFRKSGALMFLFTAIWGGIGFCFSSFWLLIYGAQFFAVVFAAIGVGILTVCLVTIKYKNLDGRKFLAVASLRFAIIVIEAFALMVAFHAIGADANYQQTAILVVASFIASVIPAGIGVRETLIAVLSPIAGIDPAIGFLAAATIRIVGVTFLIICSVFVLCVSKFRQRELQE